MKMENGEEVESNQEFYTSEDSMTNYDQNTCDYDQSTCDYDQNTCDYDENPDPATNEMSISNYKEEFYSFPDTFIQDFLQNETMCLSSIPDDIEATKAVFQQLDIMVRQQVETEIDVFKENISKILTDQQLQFKQAFGLEDQLITTEPMHVVPQSAQEEEIVSVSDDSRNTGDQTESNDSDELVDRLQWYERFVECNQDDQVILKCLVRMLTADVAITAALRRKEYSS